LDRPTLRPRLRRHQEDQRTPHRRLSLNPVTWGLRLMQLIDGRNDRLRDPYGPSTNLAIRAVRKAA